jgi:hypothetical protein
MTRQDSVVMPQADTNPSPVGPTSCSPAPQFTAERRFQQRRPASPGTLITVAGQAAEDALYLRMTTISP